MSISISEELSMLTNLNLRRNQLAHLDDRPFKRFTGLTELDLSHNKLAHLNNKPFEGLTSLTLLI